MPEGRAAVLTRSPQRRSAPRKLVCITDTPTPYRTHLFNALARELARRGIGFEVWFLAEGSPMRHWTVDRRGMAFDHWFPCGWHPTWRLEQFHVNPGVVFRMLRTPPKWLLVGGAWPMPTVAALICLAPALQRRGSRVVLWAEANPSSTRFPDGPVGALRRCLWRLVGAYAVPGEVAEQALLSVGRRDAEILHLPNVVDESRYGLEVTRLRERRDEIRAARGIHRDARVILWPARLSERQKGIINFLEAVRPLLAHPWKVVIAGEGPDRERIVTWIRESCLDVTLLGNVSDHRMLELFALSDAFILPSLRDPNPLAAIEALWAALPVIISNRCGSWPEVVSPGDNGWLVDPGDRASMCLALESLIRATPQELAAMGQRSRQRADVHYSTTRSIKRFADELESLDASS
jgi:glycosyltransferase involved in cell wall biosynthesis